jgi:hypothetical protein
MWVPRPLLDWLHISRDSVIDLREQVASLRAERDLLRNELITTKISSDWLRMKVNALEFERSALLEKAYSIKLPAPIIVKAPVPQGEPQVDDFSFDDVGDELARNLGLPVYGN